MRKWAFKITVRHVDKNYEAIEFIRKLKGVNNRHFTVNDGLDTTIEGWDLNSSALAELFKRMPIDIHNRFMDVGRRCHDSLVAGTVQDKDNFTIVVGKLERQSEYLYSHECWHAWNSYPNEPETSHYTRLTALIPIQSILNVIQKDYLQIPIVYDDQLTVLVNDFHVNVKKYLNSLKHREKRKLEPLFKRVISNGAKIRELEAKNTELILSADLKTCV